MKDKELEDIAWRLIAGAEGAGNQNRRRSLIGKHLISLDVRVHCVRWTPRGMRMSRLAPWSGAGRLRNE